MPFMTPERQINWNSFWAGSPNNSYHLTRPKIFPCTFSLPLYTFLMLPPSVRLFIVPWLIPRWAQAQVWGRFILICRGVPITEQLLAHELAHVLQWHSMGILPFMFSYVKYYFRHGYRDHPLEQQAQAAENRDFYRRWAKRVPFPSASQNSS